ncbi:RagB/SusD family nutrient uptake outer membrane protein [Lutibacter sp.]|uniref:RagB/SusD family nutrient uptake outer membrane protein n=1 Tax=Lutibacter sp. TaxID=1925666 RepID=UPI002734083A|nr:RagB/SusD family nutrient uptake outer membrane protein [Lutibacter sp.]MDP3313124.1 RagB/SusD family nutrient uptake outer membrane protein [Lutibacter sp.]
MKKYLISTVSLVLLASSIFSCTDLTEEVYSEIPAGNFLTNEQNVIAYAGRAYVKLQPYPEEQRLWSLGQNASDELVIPTKHNGEWFEQGRWEVIQKHTLGSSTANNKILTKSWDMVFEGISACNEILQVITPLDIKNKDRVIAEIKTLRAFYYYWAIDYWGNIPFSVDFSDRNPPQQKNRQFVYDFIVKEILDNVNLLQESPTPEYYGRVTKGMAYTLLAKMYINAQEWVGKNQFVEAVAACDKVIALNKYQIENDYFANFKVKNEGSKENIFVIPYHPQLTDEHFYWQALTLNADSQSTFNLAGVPWDGFVLQPDFFGKYAANDIRRKSFLFGQQYDIKGNAIVIGGKPFIYTPTIANYKSRGEWEGARVAKYEYQEKLSYDVVDMENDFVLFRYADVLYTKLEALHRGGGSVAGFINNPDLQKIRTRAGLPVYTIGNITNNELLDELGREFAWEGHRRQDQIRFGVWGNSWWEKPASGPNKKLFPIPQSALNANTNLVQNPN